MNASSHSRLLIIGSGPAALTAAIYAARAQLQPIVLEGDTPGGQLMSTTVVENWPGNISIMGPELMMNMRKQAQQWGTRFFLEKATQVDFSQSPFTITTPKRTFIAESIIIATGAHPRRLNCPGEQEYWAKGVSTCAVCDGALYKDKRVVIIGGGDTALEDASFMTHFTKNVTIIQNMDKLTGSAPMQQRVMNNPAVKIVYGAKVEEFVGEQGRLTGVRITKGGSTEIIPTDAAFLAIGLIPATDLFKGHLALSPSGHILKTEFTQTSVPGIFVAGDAADSRYRQAITSAGSGCMAALDAERYLAHR